MKKLAVSLAILALFCTGAAFAQSKNVVEAKFGTKPSSANFTVGLKYKGEAKAIAGFAFKVSYDPGQVSLTGATNNTGKSDAGVQYVVGPEVVADGKASRIVSMTTLKNLDKPGDLGELKFTKKASGDFVFSLEDRSTEPADGLQDGELKEIQHTFDVSKVAGAAL